MAGPTIKGTVSLEDKVSGPAKAAAAAIGQLASVASKSSGGLSALVSSVKSLGKNETLREAFSAAAEGVKAFGSALAQGDVKGMVEGLTDTLAGMAQVLDLVYPGLGQVTSAVIKFAGGLLGMTAGLVQAGIEMSIMATQGKQAMISMFDALGMGITTGEEVEGMLSDLSDRIGITKDQLAPLTKAFMAMGVTGTAALERLTLAAASAQAIMGDPSAATQFQELTRKIQTAALAGQGLKLGEKALVSLSKTGANVADVAKRMGMSIKDLEAGLKAGSIDATKFGDALSNSLIEKGAKPLARMGAGIDNMKKMFSQALEDMFEDIPIDDFLKQVKSLFSIFSQSSESGKAMKSAIGGAFTFIFGAMTKVVPVIKHFLLDVVIWSLKAYIFLKQHWSTIKTTLMGVAIVVGMVGAGIAAAAAVALAPMIILGAAIAAVVTGIGWLIGKVMEMGPAAIKAGADFVAGLVNGITSGIGMVADAAKNLGASAMGAIKGVLGISSPSKFALSVGTNVTGSMADSLDSGAGKVEDAAAGVGGAVTGGAAKGMSAGDYGGGGGGAKGGGAAAAGGAAGASVGQVTIQLTAPSGVTNAMELTEIAVATLFERLQMLRGGGGQPA